MTDDSRCTRPRHSIGDLVKPTRWAIAQFSAERARELTDSSGIVVSLGNSMGNKSALENEDGFFVYGVLIASPSLERPLFIHFFENELRSLGHPEESLELMSSEEARP